MDLTVVHRLPWIGHVRGAIYRERATARNGRFLDEECE